MGKRYIKPHERRFGLEPAAKAVGTSSKIEWVLYPFLAKGSSMMIYGRQGSGKSRLSWQLCNAIASGTSWFGFEVAEPGPAIFLSIDMPRHEMLNLVNEADSLGMMHAECYIASEKTPSGENFMDFNLFDNDDLLTLVTWIRDIQPKLLVVDTINDAFQVPSGQYDVNKLARDVVRGFRKVMPEGAFVYINHTRKEPAFKHGSTVDEMGLDRDAFLGASAWESAASSSLFLKRVSPEEAELYITKARLAPLEFEAFKLSVGKGGFFHPDFTMKQMLSVWPRCVPEGERFIPATKAEVFEDIGIRTRTHHDTVRQAFYRLKLQPGWATEIDGRLGK